MSDNDDSDTETTSSTDSEPKSEPSKSSQSESSEDKPSTDDPKESKSSEKPEESKESKSSEKPEESKESKSSEKPEESKESKSSEKPEESKESKSSEKPEESKESKSSEKPEESKEPKSSEKPEDSKEPSDIEPKKGSKDDSSDKESKSSSIETKISNKESKEDSDKESKSASNESKTSSKESKKSVGMESSLLAKSEVDNKKGSLRSDYQSYHQLTPIGGGRPPGEVIYDCIAFLIYCPAHEKFALNKTERAVWMPFVVQPSAKTFGVAGQDGISIVLSRGHKELDAILQKKPPIKENRLAQLARVELSDKRIVTRIIQIVKLDKNKDDFKCCQNTKRIQWWPKKEVLSGNIEKVWGPEISLIAKRVDEKVRPSMEEYPLRGVFEYVISENDERCESVLLKSLNIRQKEVEIFYLNYLKHCFPSFFVSLESFKAFMSKYGYAADDPQLIRMFSAFSVNGNPFLAFQEFLLGLAAMEPKCPSNPFRVGLVFRYYDFDGDQKLNEEELKKLLEDTSKKDDKTEDKTKEIMKKFATEGNSMTIQGFSKAVASEGVIDISGLCRSVKPIMADMTKAEKKTSKSSVGPKEKSKRQKSDKNHCMRCRQKKYDYSLHSVKLNSFGRCVEPRRIFEPQKTGEEVLNVHRFSMEYKFYSKSIPNVFLDLIRDHCNKLAKDKKNAKPFLADDKQIFMKYLKHLCREVLVIFDSERRLLKLNSPAFVIGDIGGKLMDLMQLENILWPKFPILSGNYLFLGNQVDTAANGIECVIYLLAMKLLAPTKVFLLRGSHEVKEVQEKNQFKKECLDKYGKDIGPKVWNLINSIFDKLPIASVIDESILCVNGGIPRSTTKLEDIYSIPNDLANPKKNGLAYEILNNKPMVQKSEAAVKEGFAENKSLESTYLFNKEGVNRFLSANGLKRMIRSNDIYDKKGYAYHFGGKCLTVFSNSHSKHKNKLTAAFVGSGKVRVLCIGTKTESKTKSKDSKSEESTKSI